MSSGCSMDTLSLGSLHPHRLKKNRTKALIASLLLGAGLVTFLTVASREAAASPKETVCVTLAGAAEYCGKVPGTINIQTCGDPRGTYTASLSNICGTWREEDGLSCHPTLNLDGVYTEVAYGLGHWYGIGASVKAGPCPQLPPGQCGQNYTLNDTFSSECSPACPAEAPHPWKSNGQCYPCEEGKVKRNVGTEKAPNLQCRPRCEGLTGQAKTSCEECDISGGVACRCNQLTGEARRQCKCTAFGGGAACFTPPPAPPSRRPPPGSSKPSPPPPGSNNPSPPPSSPPPGYPPSPPPPPECPPATPNRWSNGKCSQCPEHIPNFSAACNKCFVSDADKDCVEDEDDNCPGKANRDQKDLNKNGFGDVCEPKCNKKALKVPDGAVMLTGSPRAIRKTAPRIYKGDEVVFKAELDSCPDSPPDNDNEAIRIKQKSNALIQSSAVQGREITIKHNANANNETHEGFISNARGDAWGWTRMSYACPPLSTLEPLQCPKSDFSCPSGNAAWQKLVKSWQDALISIGAQGYVGAPFPDFVYLGQAHDMMDWITNDAVKQPPYFYPGPFRYSTAAAEAALEKSILAEPGKVDLPKVFELALRAAGCKNAPRKACSAKQWVTALYAGHDLLKNAASLIRRTGPCMTQHVPDSWLRSRIERTSIDDFIYHPHGPTANPREDAREICENWYNTFQADQENRDFLRLKLAAYKAIARKLVNPRPACADNGNALGVYYHFFAMGLVDYYSQNLLGGPAASAESLAQLLSGNYDPIYATWNDSFAIAFSGMALQSVRPAGR